MNKVKQFEHQGRFAIISKYRKHIIVYAIIGAFFCLYTFLGFSISRMKTLSIAGIISILYTLPVFGKSMRLRDFSFIKIFLIAFVWAFVTESIPLNEVGFFPHIISLLFLERVCFFIAITIPFDIRDIMVDTTNNVQTIPSRLGKSNSILLSIFLLIICIGIEIYINQHTAIEGLYSTILAYIITAVVIYSVKDKSHDYYFTGILDGMIMLPWLLLVVF